MSRLGLDIPTQMILYTDTIDGKQTFRDDLWAVSTADLNALTHDKDLLREAEKIIKQMHAPLERLCTGKNQCPCCKWLAKLEGK